MIKVTSEIPSYDDPIKTNVRIHSHWCNNDKVIIQIGDESREVVAVDLIAATKNAINKGRD